MTARALTLIPARRRRLDRRLPPLARAAFTGNTILVLALAATALLMQRATALTWEEAAAVSASSSTPTVDLSPLVQAAGALLMAAVSAAIAWASALLKAHVQGKAARDLIDKAAQNAAVFAQGAIERGEKLVPTQMTVHDAKVAIAADYLAAAVPDALARLGVTPDAVSRRVSAELTRIDPTVPTEAVNPPPAALAALPAPAGPAAGALAGLVLLGTLALSACATAPGAPPPPALTVLDKACAVYVENRALAGLVLEQPAVPADVRLGWLGVTTVADPLCAGASQPADVHEAAQRVAQATANVLGLVIEARAAATR